MGLKTELKPLQITILLETWKLSITFPRTFPRLLRKRMKAKNGLGCFWNRGLSCPDRIKLSDHKIKLKGMPSKHLWSHLARTNSLGEDDKTLKLRDQKMIQKIKNLKGLNAKGVTKISYDSNFGQCGAIKTSSQIRNDNLQVKARRFLLWLEIRFPVKSVYYPGLGQEGLL